MARMVISDVFSSSLSGLLVTSDLLSKNENTILQYTLLTLNSASSTPRPIHSSFSVDEFETIVSYR
jgi:hypothetical protein